MSWLKDFFSSIESNASQRITNPFYGAFILSWVIFNWQIILILFFSKKNIYSIIEDVNSRLCCDTGLVYPLLSSLGLLFLLPIANAIYSFFDAGIKYVINKSNYVTKSFDSYLARRRALIIREHRNKLKSKDLEYQLEWAKKREEISILNKNSAYANAQIAEIEELRDKQQHAINSHINIKEQLMMLSRAMGKLSAANSREPFRTIFNENQEDGPLRHYGRVQELITNINDIVDNLQVNEGWKVPQ